MSLRSYLFFSPGNRRQLLLLIGGHLLWSCSVLGLWAGGQRLSSPGAWQSGAFVALQLFVAAQLMLPALLMGPAERTRSFYLFWGVILASSIWLLNQIVVGDWQPLLAVIKSGLLLLVATLVGAVLAGYVKRLWEIVPVCMAMTLADFASWSFGPTADFAQQIQQYYLHPQGPPPLIDMVLVKMAFPGAVGLAPVFGISDWIMVVFFVIVAHRFEINDNLFGASGETLARKGRVGFYLPVSVAALFAATMLAQLTGLFIPALPVIALIMLLWYAVRYLRLRFA